jgi:hypothetical protein
MPRISRLVFAIMTLMFSWSIGTMNEFQLFHDFLNAGNPAYLCP